MLSITAVLSYLFRGGSRSVLPSHGFRNVMTSLNNSGMLIDMVKSIVPELSPSMYKGNCGRIGVIGGCQEYTGAPYFAAISALKLGADLAHVFCTEAAAPVIKSYSPELIVHPVLDRENAIEEISQWLPRLHALVIGPGLGREEDNLNIAKKVVEKARDLDIPMVIDADGVVCISQNPDVIKGYKKAVLTPNKVEFDRLYQSVLKVQPPEEDRVVAAQHLSQALGNVTVVQKGMNDIITDGNEVLVCCARGSDRRCGGQGDLLSGSMGVFLYWAHKAQGESAHNLLKVMGPQICAAYAGCLLTRECSRQAYKDLGREMTTSDMIARAGKVFKYMFEH